MNNLYQYFNTILPFQYASQQKGKEKKLKTSTNFASRESQLTTPVLEQEDAKQPKAHGVGCVYVCVNTRSERREKVQAISRTTHGWRRSRRVKGRRATPVQRTYPIPPPLETPCILCALALNMLLHASCQRRSKVPSRTTYCGDRLSFFFLYYSAEGWRFLRTGGLNREE